jgi:hypothetical protein
MERKEGRKGKAGATGIPGGTVGIRRAILLLASLTVFLCRVLPRRPGSASCRNAGKSRRKLVAEGIPATPGEIVIRAGDGS